MFAADGIQNMDFHKVHERERFQGWIGHMDDWPREAHAGVAAVVPARDPISDGRARNAQVMRGFHDAIGRNFSYIKGFVERCDLLSHTVGTVSLSSLPVK